MKEKEIEEIMPYRSQFNAVPVRQSLGLDGGNPLNIKPNERLRLANLLRRTGNLSDEEVRELGMIVKPNEQD